MQSVGHHLQVTAVQKAGVERDLFARSAYNRYYYAVFLSVRSMFTTLDPQWASQAHKSYPELLKGKITKHFKREKLKANKAGDYDLVHKLDGAIRAAAGLANLMENAYATRVVADYEPSEQVNFKTADRFSLKDVDITDAHSWVGKVDTWISHINEAWEQINV